MKFVAGIMRKEKGVQDIQKKEEVKRKEVKKERSKMIFILEGLVHMKS